MDLSTNPMNNENREKSACRYQVRIAALSRWTLDISTCQPPILPELLWIQVERLFESTGPPWLELPVSVGQVRPTG